MKRILLATALLLLRTLLFSQERVAVFPFEVMDNVISVNEQKQFYNAFSIEFTEVGKRAGLNIVPRANVDALIGQEAQFQLSNFSSKTKTAEMQRVLNGTMILSGSIGKAGTRMQVSVSLYSYPELIQQPGGARQLVANVDELFDKIPELVNTMQARINGGGTGGTDTKSDPSPQPSGDRSATLSFSGDNISSERNKQTILSSLRIVMQDLKFDLDLIENSNEKTVYNFNVITYIENLSTGLLRAEVTVTFNNNGRYLCQTDWDNKITETNEIMIANRIAERLLADKMFFDKVNESVR
jgi:TolB-like protein